MFQVVKGGAADRAGLQDDDIVVEVNGVNVEEKGHEEVVAIIRNSGNSLEMLVAKKSVYDQLKAKQVTITRLLLRETSEVQVHTADTPRGIKEERHHEEARPETPTEQARERVSGAFSVFTDNVSDHPIGYWDENVSLFICPPLWSYPNHCWMDCYEIFFRHP